MSERQGWASEQTAQAYADFCRRHDMYRATSADLVKLAAVAGDERVVDLACGTGQTTEVILEALGPGGSVLAVDGSEQMLAVARRTVTDGRVTWHHCQAEAVADVAADVDAVVCNSAIWQPDMAAAFQSVHAALRPGGRFACNIGRQFLRMPYTEEELNPRSASIHDFAYAIAVLEYGHVPRPGPRGPLLTIEHVSALLREAGFDVVDTPELRYEDPVERVRDWLSIPVFTERAYPDLTVEQRRAVVLAAYERVDKRPSVARWVALLAVKPE